MVRSLLGFALALACSAALADDKKDDQKTDEYPKRVVGKWEITKAGGDVGPGSTLEFTKDKKVVMVVKEGDKTATVKGTYAVEKDKLTVKFMSGDQVSEQTVTIKKLTDEAMEVEDSKGKVDVMKKVK